MLCHCCDTCLAFAHFLRLTSRRMTTMNFDQFLATVGDWGRFQKIKYTLICLTYMLPPIMVYTYTFTAAIPEHRCVNPDASDDDRFSNASNSLFNSRYGPTAEQCALEQNSLSFAKCRRCFRRSSDQNSLEKCSNFVFDRTYYERTLVEEVSERRSFIRPGICFSSSSGRWFAIAPIIGRRCK